MPYYGDILELAEKDEEKALKYIRADVEQSYDHYQEQFEIMKRLKKLYHLRLYDYGVGQRELRSYQPKPSELPEVFVPVSYAVCQTALAGIMGTQIPDDYEWLEVEALSDAIGREELEIARKFMLLRLQQIKYPQKLEQIVLQALQYRWSMALVHWRTEARWVKMRSETPTLDAMVRSLIKGGDRLLRKALGLSEKDELNHNWERDESYIDRSELTVLDTLDTRPDWRSGPDVEDMRFLGFYEWMPWAYLEDGEKGGVYKNISKLKEGQANKRETEPLKSEQLDSEINHHPTEVSDSREVDAEKPDEGDRIKICKYFTPDGYIVVDAGFSQIIRMERTNGIPVVNLTFGKRTSSPDAESLLELIEPFNYQLNFMFSMRLENQDRAIRGLVGIDSQKLTEGQGEIVLGQHDVIEFDGPPRDAMYGIDVPMATEAWEKDIELVFNLIARLTGMDENSQALYFSGGARTATEADIVKEAMMTRLGRLNKSVERDVQTPAITRIYDLEDVHFDKEETVAILGPDADYFPVMNRDLLDRIGGNLRWIPKGSNYWQSKRERAAALSELMSEAATLPGLIQEIDLRSLWIERARAIGLVDPEHFLINKDKGLFTRPIPEEHKLMSTGMSLEVGELDDHQEHLDEHQAYADRVEGGMVSPAEFPVGYLRLLREHIEKHNEALAELQTPNPKGLSNQSVPGQDLSQNTEGNKTSNMENVQTPGVAPKQGGPQ